jgi:iron complex outermembrane receptor protein
VSFLAGGEYSLEESLGRFTLRAEVTYASRIFFSAFDREEVSTGPHTRVNAYLNFVTPDDRWSLSLAGRNLSNVIAPTNAYVTTSLVGYIVNANIEQPRTFVATFGYKF